MIIHQFKSAFGFLAQPKQLNFLSLTFFLLFSTLGHDRALAASFITFNGNIVTESEWQAAAGTTVLEDFESFPVSSQISTLPQLGVEFDSLAGGGFPHIYNHFECCVTPYGSKHLGNFPNGINQINRGDDIVLRVLPDSQITALGFWNGDGQADTFNATVYDSSDNILGSIGAFKGTFAGFISDIPISRVVFDGNTGDGWNHLDALQTNASGLPPSSTTIPEPTTILGLFSLVLFGLSVYSRKT